MGKLLDLFRGVPTQRRVERLVTGRLVDVEIVGESFHQPHIRQVAKRERGGEFEITLIAEPQNKFDPNAVVVMAHGAPVGHLSREMAIAWQPQVLAAASEGFRTVGTARVFGGTQEKPSVGVFGSAPWTGTGSPPKRPGR
jgi:hypothetical protein